MIKKNSKYPVKNCYFLQERGAVGETILHLCLLNVSSLLADLAKRLLRFYPKLINDVYMSDEYYGKCNQLLYYKCSGNRKCQEISSTNVVEVFNHKTRNFLSNFLDLY